MLGDFSDGLRHWIVYVQSVASCPVRMVLTVPDQDLGDQNTGGEVFANKVRYPGSTKPRDRDKPAGEAALPSRQPPQRPQFLLAAHRPGQLACQLALAA